MSKAPFIIVFRPHITPAWAETFASEQQFVNAWINGAYAKRCSADNALASENPSYQDAVEDVGHDLHNLTRLDNVDEVQRYLNEEDYAGRHNKGYGAVAEAARELGWMPEESEEETDEE
jgi:hypothetical protein